MDPRIYLGPAVTVALALVGWLVKALWMTSKRTQANHDRLIKLETTVGTAVPSLDQTRTQQQEAAIRLASTELAISQLKDSQRRFEDIADQIKEKLDCVPRIEEALKHLGIVCQAIVPRSELEVRFKALGEK